MGFNGHTFILTKPTFHTIIIPQNKQMREFILSSNQAKKIAADGDSLAIRTFLKKIGSNFTVKGKKFDWLAKRGYRIVGEINPFPISQARSDSNREPRFWRPMFYHWNYRPIEQTPPGKHQSRVCCKLRVYFVSLCLVCFLQNLHILLSSKRVFKVFLFFLVK